MSLLVKGMEMPTFRDDYVAIVIYGNGTIRSTHGNVIEGATAVSVPPHGRCIDADALKASLAFAEKTAEWAVPALRAVLMIIDEMPTIIPAESVENK